jgi:hypothetical protein
MTTDRRRRYMSDYMKKYRQDLAKREDLKRDHRLNSFKWRLSTLLSAQYEILFYVQYEAIEWIDKEMIPDWSRESMWTNLDSFPVLDYFWCMCDTGGNEVFKLFLFMKFNRKHDQVIYCVVGVLDKEALLKNLKLLTGKIRKELNSITEKVEVKAREERWRKLDFSTDSVLWLKQRIYCSPLKWTVRKRPNWKSADLRDLLRRWETGSRQVGKWERWERGVNNDPSTRGIFSPILRA